MARLPLLCPAVAAVACLAGTSATAQTFAPAPVPVSVQQIAANATQGDLRGTVLDEHGKPLAGAVISAVGATSVFAVTDREGSFVLRNLPAGPYLLRAHLKGYVSTRGRMIQVSAAINTVPLISLSRRPEPTDEPQVLEAGVGPSPTSGETVVEQDDKEEGEVAWRLRHLKRSVLKDADFGDFADGDTFLDDPIDGVGRAIEVSARAASSWFSDLALNGQINLLTRTSFDRPQDLLSLRTAPPAGITYVGLSAPSGGGDWSMRGAMSQGDLSSWILSGGYVRRAPSSHQYEAGVSYSTQRYLGGSLDALTAVTDGARSVGAVHAYDHWTVAPSLAVTYGAKYARYDYLDRSGLLSPSLSVSITPIRDSSFRINASASRQEVAPGAEEFLPPSTGLWLPPERTFSAISPNHAISPERVDRVEISAERQWVGDFMIGLRAYRETVDDQMVTLFGGIPAATSTSMGHYYVASGGDFTAVGWGLHVSRDVVEGLRASIEYTQTDADWSGTSPDRGRLRPVAASALRTDSERVHDLTASVESDVQATATRFLVVYKVNSAFATGDGSLEAKPGLRFDVQVNQALPFLNFASAQWEVLVAVRNMFRDDFREGSVYDELLVIRPPKRVVGGLTVRF